MKPFPHRLMLVMDRTLADIPYEEAAAQALGGGVRCVQLREKDLEKHELIRYARWLSGLCGRVKASLIINTDADAALEVDADGVHLPASGVPISEMRAILAENRWIGRSTHSVKEAMKAEEDGADYCLLGPIYETPSKKQFGKPLGLEALRETAKKVRIPVLAIGGITIHTMDEVLQAGASGIAVMRAILLARDIRKTATLFTDKLKDEVRT